MSIRRSFYALVAVAILLPASGTAYAVKGGEHTTHAQYPWTVVITRPGSAHPQKVSCGGALVRPTKVVTAAHCLDPQYGDYKDKTVIWGRTDLTTNDGTVAKIASYWIHPDYQWGSLAGDDVAVLTLDQPVGTASSLLELATGTSLNAIGTQTVLASNGKTGAGTTTADYDPVIKKATLPIIDPDATGGCKNIGWTFTPAKHLCFGPTKNDTLGVCSGDSGSPLVVSTPAGYRQVGLIESGDSQCQGPQVGTKITNYEPLIRAQLDGDPPDPPTSGPANGTFETGTTSSWTSAGVVGTVNTGAHGGTYAARLGATTATNGESKVSQTFTATTNRLSFWYSMTCPDTVTYAWAKATLTDTTAGTTSTPLAKTCTKGQGWKQVTAGLTTGHTYTLTLINRDDNHPADPVSTLYDDVTVDAGARMHLGTTQHLDG
jgi:secreted trypsin-like serine protease